jgi:ribonuclease HII
VAKVTRDRMMVELHGRWPRYGFDEHKAYVTPVHAAALRAHGPCPEHRVSYANVAAVLGGRRAARHAVEPVATPGDGDDG